MVEEAVGGAIRRSGPKARGGQAVAGLLLGAVTLGITVFPTLVGAVVDSGGVQLLLVPHSTSSRERGRSGSRYAGSLRSRATRPPSRQPTEALV